MVRKWSYLNGLSPAATNFSTSPLLPIHTFKVFKATTRFKKHHTVNTRMVRKVYAKRRHKNNWLGMSHVLKGWVVFFLKTKQFVRFYQTLGLFSNQFYSTTTNLFNKQYLNLVGTAQANTFACSNQILKAFINPYKNTLYTSPLKNSPTSGLLTINATTSLDITEVNPGLFGADKLFVPYNDPLLTSSKILSKEVLYMVLDSQSRYITSLNIAIYRILILLTLFRIHNTV